MQWTGCGLSKSQLGGVRAMRGKEVLRPRLHGRRFEGGVIPLAFLKDLAALQEMVVEVAKWRYLQDNPDRKRIPRGFTSDVILQLAALEDGSALPVINLATTREAATVQPRTLSHERCYTAAIKDIIDAVDALDMRVEHTLNGLLPRELYKHFNRFGRSLREGEFIELSSPFASKSARLDKEKRQRLLAISRLEEHTQAVVLRGSVPEADQDSMRFQLQQIHGHRVSGQIPEQHFDSIMEAFASYRDGARLLVEGIGRYSQQGQLLRLDSVERVMALAPLDVTAQLDDLRNLEDGWADGVQYAGDWGKGYGKAPSHAGLDWLSARFTDEYPDDLPRPYIYPTPEGGVQLEWRVGTYDISLEVELEARVGDWHNLNMEDIEADTRLLNLDDSRDWGWLNTELKRLMEIA